MRNECGTWAMARAVLAGLLQTLRYENKSGFSARSTDNHTRGAKRPWAGSSRGRSCTPAFYAGCAPLRSCLCERCAAAASWQVALVKLKFLCSGNPVRCNYPSSSAALASLFADAARSPPPRHRPRHLRSPDNPSDIPT